MVLVQVLVIVISLFVQPSTDFDKWLWQLDQEWNIPAKLSSAQLAVVGGIALITSWYAHRRPSLERLYLLAIGLVFLFLAYDEYYMVHESFRHSSWVLAALGVLVATATVVVAAYSPRRTWKWFACFLMGLVIVALGGLVIDEYHGPRICGSWGFLLLDRCLKVYPVEESLEIAGVWLTLVGMLGYFSYAVPAPKLRVRLALYTLPVLWIFLLIHMSMIPSIDFLLLSRPASVQFESEINLVGYRLERDGETTYLRLYATAKQQRNFLGTGFSVHLVDQVNGKSVAGHDESVDRKRLFWFLGLRYEQTYREWMEIEIPPLTPVNRALWVVLTHWRERDGDFVRQQVLASDLQLLDETQVLLGELVLPELKHAPATDLLAEFDDGFILHTVDMPENARSGVALPITFTWQATADGFEDLVQFLHLGHETSGEWWVYDQQPLGARLPTRLWYKGLVDSETWQVPLSADLAHGRYRVFTGLYRIRNLERILARDGDGALFVDARVPLGTLVVER